MRVRAKAQGVGERAFRPHVSSALCVCMYYILIFMAIIYFRMQVRGSVGSCRPHTPTNPHAEIDYPSPRGRFDPICWGLCVCLRYTWHIHQDDARILCHDSRVNTRRALNKWGRNTPSVFYIRDIWHRHEDDGILTHTHGNVCIIHEYASFMHQI